MFRLPVRRSFAFWCVVLCLSSAAFLRTTPARADKEGEEKASPGEAGKHQIDLAKLPQKKFKVLFTQSGLEEEKEFDLSKPEDREELHKLLMEGNVIEISLVRQPSLVKLEADLAFWTLLVFIILMVLLYKLAWGPMLNGLKKREENISGALEAAQKANEDAKKLQASLEEQMAQANQRVNALMDETRKAAARTQEEMLSKARAEIAAERDRLRRELDTARDQALQDLSSYAARLATDVAGRILRRDLNVDDQRRLVDEALGEMHQAAAERNRVLSGA
jgi:F-type H+-transporting ATPase subunit b